MRKFDRSWLKTSVVEVMSKTARRGTFGGGANAGDRAYLDACHGVHQPSGTILVFTRDVGYHSSGWWKNPDYERCLHFSLSFRDPTNGDNAPRDKKLTKEWLELFFGKDLKLLWCEPPFSPEGKHDEVWHYRLFCTPNWTPLKPRGEVYNKEFTEYGWKSYSDVQAELMEAQDAAQGRQVL